MNFSNPTLHDGWLRAQMAGQIALIPPSLLKGPF